ncbi:hypothetical protein H6S82_25695 [Planktothrix sp. FACHB-1355]|uniref:Uncharacterized protein n=1 Tax=Aerosakkonema funiforme FACHB-1375 TaxID=2949571 RepID=A0A926ZFJ3_9CYAN|nr:MULTISPECIES: hypothetical protein [Oscillatoriales]MBD2180920.1 hypothetical protein [Aerosakkonema funiforme FACHB-1375]MBD3562213.1 hypothetical protein [Planktothrix sp. FACHB-1355]
MGRKEAISKAREGENLRLMARYNQDEYIEDNINQILNDAAQYFKEATTEDSTYAWAWAHWGVTLSYLGGIEKRLNPSKSNFYNEADSKYENAIQCNPNYAWALAHRGENKIWWAIDQKTRGIDKNVKILLTDAEQYLNQAIEIDANYTWAYVRRGFVYRFLGLLNGEDGGGQGTQQQPYYDRAIQDFNSAIQGNDKYAWARAFRAVVHRQKARALQDAGLIEEARREWELTYQDVETALKTYAKVFKRPKVLDLGFLFLPPYENPRETHSFDESPSGQYAQLALHAYEEGYERLNKEEIDRVLANIAKEWVSVAQ